jgi:hypothetical protein
VGVLVDAHEKDLPLIAGMLATRGIRASFELSKPPSQHEMTVFGYGDGVVPKLSGGGLVRWIGTGDHLQDLAGALGVGGHFLYASSGPSVGQWWLAHGAGGRLIAGAIKLDNPRDTTFSLHPGEVVELKLTASKDPMAVIDRLAGELLSHRLTGVPVTRLMRDSGTPV